MIQACLLSNDDQTIAELQASLREAGAEVTVCRRAELAIPVLARQHFDGIFIDYDDPETTPLIATMRGGQTPLNGTLCCALASSYNSAAAFNSGATLVLEKPLSGDVSRRCFHLAHALMLREHRRYHRHAISLPVHLRIGGAWKVGETVNINEKGMCVLSPVPLLKGAELSLRVALPGALTEIQGQARVVWCDTRGQGGLQFVSLSLSSRVVLNEWLADRTADAIRTGMAYV